MICFLCTKYFFYILHWNFCDCILLANHPINFNNMGQLFISNFRHIKFAKIMLKPFYCIFFCRDNISSVIWKHFDFLPKIHLFDWPKYCFWITSSYWKLNSTMSEIELYYKRVASCFRIAFLAKRLKKLTFFSFFFQFFFLISAFLAWKCPNLGFNKRNWSQLRQK